jgi:hypothetical protein
MASLLAHHSSLRPLLAAAGADSDIQGLIALAYQRDIVDALDAQVLARLWPDELQAVDTMLGRAEPTAYDRAIGDWLAEHVTPSATLARAMRQGGLPPGTNALAAYARAVKAAVDNFLARYAAFVADFDRVPEAAEARLQGCLPDAQRTPVLVVCLRKSVQRAYASAQARAALGQRLRMLLLNVHPHLVLHFPALDARVRPAPSLVSLRTNLRLLADPPPQQPDEPGPFPFDWDALPGVQWQTPEEAALAERLFAEEWGPHVY